MPTLEQCRPLRLVLLVWVSAALPEQLLSRTAHFLLMDLVADTLTLLLLSLFDVLHIDELGFVLPVFVHLRHLCSAPFVFRGLNWDVSWRAIWIHAVICDLVVPSLSLLHVRFQLCQAILVLIIHKPCSEQVLHAAPLLVFFRGLAALVPLVEGIKA